MKDLIMKLLGVETDADVEKDKKRQKEAQERLRKKGKSGHLLGGEASKAEIEKMERELQEGN